MKSLNDLTIQLYADGADKAGILDLYAKPYIKGLTTNPSLMKKAGIKDYEAFAKDVLQTVTNKPISLEVFTDDLVDMKRQALKINAWGKNVYTKIPITNSRGDSAYPASRPRWATPSIALRWPQFHHGPASPSFPVSMSCSQRTRRCVSRWAALPTPWRRVAT